MSARHRWFPGYTVAAVATVGLFATGPGQTFVVSQFNTPIRESLGIEPLALNSAYTLATVLAGFPLVMVGAWTDRLGVRRMLALIALLFGLGCFAFAAAQDIVTLFVGFFLLRFLGQGSLGLVSQHAVAMWFHRRLGRVHGVKLVVAFLAWAMAPQAALALTEAVGWRWTYAVFGAAVWLMVIPLALLFVRDRPEDLGLRMDNDREDELVDAEPDPVGAGPTPTEARSRVEPAFTLREAMRTGAYWALAAAVFVPPLVGTAFLFDVQPILARRGMDASDAAAVVSVWSVTAAVMSLPAGMVTDRLRAGPIIAAGMVSIIMSSFLLWRASTVWEGALSLALYGVGQSLVMACGSAAIARYFGRAHHGAIRSSVTRLAVIGTGIGPLITGLSEHLTGGYGLAMAVCAGMCVPVALAGLWMHAPAPLEHHRERASGAPALRK